MSPGPSTGAATRQLGAEPGLPRRPTVVQMTWLHADAGLRPTGINGRTVGKGAVRPAAGTSRVALGTLVLLSRRWLDASGQLPVAPIVHRCLLVPQLTVNERV